MANSNSLRSFFAWVISLCTVISSTSVADGDGEVAIAKAQLNQQIILMTEIEIHVEEPNLPRFRVLKMAAERVLNSVNQDGLGNDDTLGEYRRLVQMFNYSADWFSKISTQMTFEKINQIIKLNEEIAKARKIKGLPTTKNTATIYSDIKTLLDQLRANPQISDKLKKKIDDLNTPIGMVISRALAMGDRPLTFEAAIPLYRSITSLYEDMNEMKSGSSESLFPILFEIMVLNESFGSFAQVERSSIEQSSVEQSKVQK